MAENEKEEVHISLTSKQVGVALAVLVAFTSAFPAINLLYPTARSLPFTTLDGERLSDKIEKLDEELSEDIHDIKGTLSDHEGRLRTFRREQTQNTTLVKHCLEELRK